MQLTQLRAFTHERRLVMVFLSQIDRAFDASRQAVPSLGNVRLPNPLDLQLFDKTCFLNGREVRIAKVGPQAESMR